MHSSIHRHEFQVAVRANWRVLVRQLAMFGNACFLRPFLHFARFSLPFEAMQALRPGRKLTMANGRARE